MNKKKVFLIITMLLFLNFLNAQDNNQSLNIENISSDTIKDISTMSPDSIAKFRSALIDSIINYGSTYLGLKYRWAGITPAGFDCSGFMFHIHRHFNLPLPRVPSATSKIGKIIFSLDSLQRGDLIYFQNRAAIDNTIGHVAIVVEAKKDKDTIVILHSASHLGVAIENIMDKRWYTSRYLYANRLPDEFYMGLWNDSLMRKYSIKYSDDLAKYQIEHPNAPLPLASPPAGSIENIYSVKDGDNLYDLAIRFNVKISDIKAWNGLYSDRLSIGQTLKIYQSKEVAAKTTNTTTKTTTKATTKTSKKINPADYTDYTIVKGDTPYGIATKHNMSVSDFLEINNISDHRSLQIGQIVKVKK